jgi:hypothetical protein
MKLQEFIKTLYPEIKLLPVQIEILERIEKGEQLTFAPHRIGMSTINNILKASRNQQSI